MESADEGRGGSPQVPHAAPRQFHLLAKPAGAICNLDCTYCFFLSKEMLYPGSRFRMADELLETYLRQANPLPPVTPLSSELAEALPSSR